MPGSDQLREVTKRELISGDKDKGKGKVQTTEKRRK